MRTEQLVQQVVSYTNVPENAAKSPEELGVDAVADCMGVPRSR